MNRVFNTESKRSAILTKEKLFVLLLLLRLRIEFKILTLFDLLRVILCNNNDNEK